MKCEVCGAEVVNSEEMKAHMEREHPIGERDEQELEEPDYADDKVEPAPVIPGKS